MVIGIGRTLKGKARYRILRPSVAILSGSDMVLIGIGRTLKGTGQPDILSNLLLDTRDCSFMLGS